MEDIYKKAILFTKSHYENFPVVSFLIPKKLQPHIAIIYWFARTADDFSDEGNLAAEERLQLLSSFEFDFKQMLTRNFKSDYFRALGNTIDTYSLTPENFLKLLKAFKQDVYKKRYETYKELKEYCSNSANPVGRLILELFGFSSLETIELSDKICTGLQITNFLQDVSKDIQKGRIYIPKEDMVKYKLSEKDFDSKANSESFKSMIKFQVERTNQLFEEGKPLISFLSGRLKLEIMWTLLGGEQILKEIKKIDYDVLNKRPILSKFTFLLLLLNSFKYVSRISKRDFQAK